MLLIMNKLLQLCGNAIVCLLRKLIHIENIPELLTGKNLNLVKFQIRTLSISVCCHFIVTPPGDRHVLFCAERQNISF